jgi:RNA polymerase sigma-70 factor (ECF subfamily)
MSSYSNGKPDERPLVIAAQRGDSEAFAALVRLHQRRAYAVCRAIVLTHEDAEDAVQEGFLHAFKALDRFLPDQPFGAWLYRIMANASLDLVPRSGRIGRIAAATESGADEVDRPAASSDCIA